jgi:hypothetical protein
MGMQLPEVTLCCVDTRNPALALWALQRCMAQIGFAEVLLFTSAALVPSPPPGVRVIDVQVDSVEAYSQFMLRGLAAHVQTSHLLVAQWDGFVRDASRWEPAFLEHDYIGAPWRQPIDGQLVGNGGFSLRSRRLLQALLDPDVRITHPEDESICVVNRELLETRHAIRIAPLDVAGRFSYERVEPPGPTFGFHGLFNFPRELTAAELNSAIAELPEQLTRGLDAHDLCRTFLAMGELELAHLLLAKRRRLGMHDRRTLRLVMQLWLARRRQGGLASRNIGGRGIR